MEDGRQRLSAERAARLQELFRHAVALEGEARARYLADACHTDLQLWCGTGQPGPYDEPGPDTPAGVAIEQFTYDSTTFFVEAAEAEGVDHVFHDYGAGTHSWPACAGCPRWPIRS